MKTYIIIHFLKLPRDKMIIRLLYKLFSIYFYTQNNPVNKWKIFFYLWYPGCLTRTIICRYVPVYNLWLECVSSPRSSLMNSPESGDQITATSTHTQALGVEGCHWTTLCLYQRCLQPNTYQAQSEKRN